MARKNDLSGLLRGLDLIRKALVDSQGKELRHMWENSSLKSAAEGLGAKVQENVNKGPQVSDLTKKIQNDITLMYTQTAEAVKEIRNTGQATEPPTSASDSQEPPSSTSSSDNYSDINKYYDVSSAVHDHSEQMSPHVNVNIGDNLKDATISQTLARETVTDNTVSDHSKVNMNVHEPNIKDGLEANVHIDLSEASTIHATQTKKMKDTHKAEVKLPKQPKPKSSILSSFKPQLSDKAQERKVPSSRLGRVFTFGSLAAGLGMGALSEVTKKSLGLKKEDVNGAIMSNNPFLTEANMNRIVDTLCRVRGAALKLGQMLSLQDESLVSQDLLNILERVRQSADFMPAWQMERVLKKAFGPEWRDKMASFDEKPFAAASIGQVHKAVLHDGREVAMKIQYPGVAKSIDSDINNLMSILKVWDILPKGLYVDSMVKTVRTELAWEVDYMREAECSKKFKELLKDDHDFLIPEVIDELTTTDVLTSEFIEGIPLDKCFEIDQESKNKIGEKLLTLCLRELFEFRLMQTDPNWANFFYNPDTGKIILLDFGATREFSKKFTDGYIRVIKAAADGDRDLILTGSQKLGFLTGYETKEMEKAHVDAVMILGEAFALDDEFDFHKQDTTRRIHNLIPTMVNHRLTPPPEETYSLHRKMSGAFLACTKLSAKINCRRIFDPVWNDYRFDAVDQQETDQSDKQSSSSFMDKTASMPLS